MKKTNRLLTVILGFSLTGLLNCNSSIEKGHGYLTTMVNFPQNKAFSIKVIPDETVKISVVVTGDGLDEAITFELTKEEPRRLLTEVPVGEKTVNASAFDSDGQILAQGSSTVTVTANENTQARIVLAPGILPTPTPTPSAEPTPSSEPTAEPTVIPVDIPTEQPVDTPTEPPSSGTPSEPDLGSGGGSNDDHHPTPTPTASGASINIGVTIGNGNPVSPEMTLSPTPIPTGGDF